MYGLIRSDNNADYLTEGSDFEISADESGGTIIFSTDVNAIPLSENKVTDWIKQSSNLVRWTIGKGLLGKFTVNKSKTFGENSLSIDLVGIDTDKLLKIATELCNLFTKESVLVKDYNTQKVYFVNGD